MSSVTSHESAQGHRPSRVETAPVSSRLQQWEYDYAEPIDGRRRPDDGVGLEEDVHREAMRTRGVHHGRRLGPHDPEGPYREREAIHRVGPYREREAIYDRMAPYRERRTIHDRVRPYREREVIHTRVKLHRKHEEAPLKPRADSTSDTDEDPGVDTYYFDYDPEPVFYSFGELATRENGSPQLGGDGFSDNESGAVVQDDEVSAADATLSPAAYHVLESQYSSDGYEQGHHSVKLTAVLSEKATVSQAMFRWM